MDCLANDEIFQNTEILVSPEDNKRKMSNWFITFFSDVWNDEKDVELALEDIKLDLSDIRGAKTGDKKLIHALINAELCPETGRLHFHIAARFKDHFRPLIALREIFGTDAKILGVMSSGVDTVSKYCSKKETRVGDCMIIAESESIEAFLRDKYVDKWVGKVVKKDGVKSTLEREKKVKDGRVIEAQKRKAIATREALISSNIEMMNKIAGKVGQRGRWEMLRDENVMCKEEVEKIKALEVGEPMFGEEIDLNELEEVQWPEEKVEEENLHFGTIEDNPGYLSRWSTLAYWISMDELDSMIRVRTERLRLHPERADCRYSICGDQIIGLKRQIQLLKEEKIKLEEKHNRDEEYRIEKAKRKE